MMTHQEAKDRLAKRPRVKLRHNTYLMKGENGSVGVIRFHETDIITLNDDDTYTIRTGGWFTPTTKARLNEYTPISVWSDGGMWFFVPKGGRFEDRFVFADGMKVRADGTPVGDLLSEKDLRARYIKVARKVKVYINGFIDHIKKNGAEMSSLGDCFLCSMDLQLESQASMTMDHIASHIDEGYYVPSLLVRALHESGHRVVKEGSHRVLPPIWRFIQTKTPPWEWVVKKSLQKFFRTRMHELAEWEDFDAQVDRG